MSQSITTSNVHHVAQLAHIPVTAEEEKAFTAAFADTIKVVEQLKEVDVTGVEPTHQVTGMENVWREDQVVKAQMFTQAEALANAAQTHQGYFVVPQIIDQDE